AVCSVSWVWTDWIGGKSIWGEKAAFARYQTAALQTPDTLPHGRGMGSWALTRGGDNNYYCRHTNARMSAHTSTHTHTHTHEHEHAHTHIHTHTHTHTRTCTHT